MKKKKSTPLSAAPQPQMQQPQVPQQNLSVEQMLFQLNMQFDNIKTSYNNIILQQDQKIRELMQKNK